MPGGRHVWFSRNGRKRRLLAMLMDSLPLPACRNLDICSAFEEMQNTNDRDPAQKNAVGLSAMNVCSASQCYPACVSEVGVVCSMLGQTTCRLTCFLSRETLHLRSPEQRAV